MQLIKHDAEDEVDIGTGVLWLLLVAAAIMVVTLSVRLVDTRNELRLERERMASIIIDNECIKRHAANEIPDSD